MSQIAIYCGWYDGDADGPFTQPKVEFMPGAFAYHLHSFSAASIRSTTHQFWVGPLLAKGATCTMGCVYEPYLPSRRTSRCFIARLMAQRLHVRRSGVGGATGLVLADDRRRRSALPPVWKIAAGIARRNSRAITVRSWNGRTAHRGFASRPRRLARAGGELSGNRRHQNAEAPC